MLAEIAAANAAFSIIKRALANGRELMDCGKAVGDFVNAKDALGQQANRKKNSFWNRVGGNAGNELEEFMALEKINANEQELKEAMIYTGRPGLWQDWIRFQGEIRVTRANAIKQAQRQRAKTIDTIAKFFLGFLVLLIFIGAAGVGIYWYRNQYN